MTPSTIGRVIVVVWLTAAVMTLPAYAGFFVVGTQPCIVTLFLVYESAVELVFYVVNVAVIVFVYVRIWSTAARHHSFERRAREMQHKLAGARCPTSAAAASDVAASSSIKRASVSVEATLSPRSVSSILDFLIK